jgi:hypothetical protein
LDQLSNAHGQAASVKLDLAMNQDDKLQLDYENTIGQFEMLADIRFKLLALLPTVTGVAIALLGKERDNQTALAVGTLGLLTSFGITLYEIRNSQLYDSLVHRARGLERLLGLVVLSKGNATGGMFSERPERELKLFGKIQVWHKLALAVVYGTVLGSWCYLVIASLFSLMGYPSDLGAALIAALLGTVLAWEYLRLSKHGRPAYPEWLDKKSLIDLNEQLLRAEESGSRDGIEPWLDQDFTIIRASGAKQDRQTYLDAVQANAHRGRSADEIEVHMYEKCAVYICRVTTTKNPDGTESIRRFWNTRLFVREGSEWRCAAWQVTEIRA